MIILHDNQVAHILCEDEQLTYGDQPLSQAQEDLLLVCHLAHHQLNTVKTSYVNYKITHNKYKMFQDAYMYSKPCTKLINIHCCFCEKDKCFIAHHVAIISDCGSSH